MDNEAVALAAAAGGRGSPDGSARRCRPAEADRPVGAGAGALRACAELVAGEEQALAGCIAAVPVVVLRADRELEPGRYRVTAVGGVADPVATLYS